MKSSEYQKPEQLEPLLTIPRVAQILGVSRPTVYVLMDIEGLPYVKLRGSRRVIPSSFRVWLTSRERLS